MGITGEQGRGITGDACGRFQCSRMACVHLARRDSQRRTAERVAGGACCRDSQRGTTERVRVHRLRHATTGQRAVLPAGCLLLQLPARHPSQFQCKRGDSGQYREGVIGVGAEEAGEHVRDGDGAHLARSRGGASPSALVRLLRLWWRRGRRGSIRVCSADGESGQPV
jgi:hypothetical protein